MLLLCFVGWKEERMDDERRLEVSFLFSDSSEFEEKFATSLIFI